MIDSIKNAFITFKKKLINGNNKIKTEWHTDNTWITFYLKNNKIGFKIFSMYVSKIILELPSFDKENILFDINKIIYALELSDDELEKYYDERDPYINGQYSMNDSNFETESDNESGKN
jgi:hypothetical protein